MRRNSRYSASSHQPQTESVNRLLQNLGGVYRDPSRVSRDANALLNHPSGQYLKPKIAPLVEDDGTSCSTLMLKGTITMTYRGGTYNIPIDLHIPSAYPSRAPVIFVRPVESMMIKEGHTHVGADGKVYMPYLHGWRPHSHQLVDTCHHMSSIFGNEPPVFARPPGHVSRPVQRPQQQATPPKYEDIAMKNALAESAREAEAAAERERQSIQAAQYEITATDESREQLKKKYQSSLMKYKDEATKEIGDHLKEQILLDKSMLYVTGVDGDVSSGQMAYLETKKKELEEQHEKIDDQISQMEEFINQAEEEEATTPKKPIDLLATPTDIHSAQLLALSAENAAITDTLFFLDKGLAKGLSGFGLEEHLKMVRKLANRQFLIRAHLLKVGQVKIYSQRNLDC